MQLDQYSEPEELLADESFLNWYFKPGDEKDRLWEDWVNADEGHRELVRQAMELLELARLPEKRLPQEQIDRAAARLQAGINGLDQAAKGAKILPLKRLRWIVAACCAGLLLAGGILYTVYHSRPSEIKTEYGQLGEQVLPDGTEVTMNANSRLQFASSGWAAGADREVWIKGEAFFHVSHTPEKSRFIVHLDHSDVIVTGTRFNVVNRPGKESVLLEEGAVTLRATCGKVFNMKPGDFVAFNQDQPAIASAKPDSLMAWKKRMVFLDNTPLRELVNIVYDQYGVQLHLADDSIGSKTVTAIIPNNNLETLLKGLEGTKEYEVIRQDGGEITIAARR